MTRRALFAAFAAVALDPERLLWVPGKKFISIPNPPAADVFMTIELWPMSACLAGDWTAYVTGPYGPERYVRILHGPQQIELRPEEVVQFMPSWEVPRDRSIEQSEPPFYIRDAAPQVALRPRTDWLRGRAS